MDEYEKEKTKFLETLNKLHGWILRKLFKIESFSEEEINALNECLNKLVSFFSRYFDHYLTQLKPQHCYKILKIRSVLEFFKTDFINFTNDISKETLIELTAYDSDLWDKVNNYSSNDRLLSGWDRGELPNISGIPESHYWWTSFNRKGEENPYKFNFEKYAANIFPDYKSI
uniref:Uncharacterized protein n=1 Tax=Panagrolaimus superbus TaxID=310955 RepID=A0A914YEK6_9BILA